MSTIEPAVASHPRYMTEAEFDAWAGEDTRAEWVRGEAIVHMPSTPAHNLLEVWLLKLISFFVERHALGLVFGSEVEIRVPGVRRLPDVCFVARERAQIVQPTRIEGAPDLIIEIVSPDSVARDWRDKYLDYEAMGVREYWVVDLDYRQLRAYALGADGRYGPIAERDGKVYSRVLQGFWIRPSDMWQEPLPDTLPLLQELGVMQ